MSAGQGPHIGRRVRLSFSANQFTGRDGVVDGTVVAYSPAPPGSDDPALWRVRHDDGDSEELELEELRVALQSYERWQVVAPHPLSLPTAPCRAPPATYAPLA